MAELNKVVCVEDDADIRSIIELALQDLGGFDLKVYESGTDALEGLPGAAADLIVLDVMMPGMDGKETLRNLRAMPEFSDTPIVFMTAKAQPSELDQYMELGAIGVITKPFDPMTLADQLRDLWGGGSAAVN